MKWGLNARGADDLADRLAQLAELPFLDEALLASLEGARQRIGAGEEVATLAAEEGHVLRLPAEPFGADEFGTLERPARPTLGPALLDGRDVGLLATLRKELRVALARTGRGTA